MAFAAALPELPALLGAAGAVFVGIFVQASVGFGAGLFAVPLLLLTGSSLPVAIATLLSVVFVQTAWQSWQYRREIPKEAVRAMLLPRLVGVPVGVLLLGMLEEQGERPLRVALALFLIVAAALQGMGGATRRRGLAPAWTPVAGASSGFLAGLFGMGGPPLVLWMLAQDWPPARARSFLWASFFVLGPPQLLFLYWGFGARILDGMLLGLVLVPVLLVASMLGERVGSRWSSRSLRRVTLTLLVVLALRTAWSGLA